MRVTRRWWRPRRGQVVSTAKWQDLPSVARELDRQVEWTIAFWQLRSELLALPRFPPEVVAVSKLPGTERVVWSPGAQAEEEDISEEGSISEEECADVDVAAAQLLAARLAQRCRAPPPAAQPPAAAQPPPAPQAPEAAEPPPRAAVLHRRQQQRSLPVYDAERREVVAIIHHAARAEAPGDCYVRCSRCQARATRTLAGAAGGRRQGQGRPLGFLAWWGAFDCQGDADAHRHVGPHPDHAARAAAREALKGVVAYLDLTGCKRRGRRGRGRSPSIPPHAEGKGEPGGHAGRAHGRRRAARRPQHGSAGGEGVGGPPCCSAGGGAGSGSLQKKRLRRVGLTTHR